MPFPAAVIHASDDGDPRDGAWSFCTSPPPTAGFWPSRSKAVTLLLSVPSPHQERESEPLQQLPSLQGLSLLPTLPLTSQLTPHRLPSCPQHAECGASGAQSSGPSVLWSLKCFLPVQTSLATSVHSHSPGTSPVT